MTRFPYAGLAFAALLAACGGGGGGDDDDDGDGGDNPPSAVSAVADEGFDQATGVAMSPDGEVIYFTAYTRGASPQAAVFKVAADGGEVTQMTSGGELEYAGALEITDDGGKLIVGELAASEEGIDEGRSPLYTLGTSGGELSPLETGMIGRVTGVALADNGRLYVTGYTLSDNAPGLFTVPLDGGPAEAVLIGAPLEQPAGLDVDEDHVAWVVDNRSSRALGSALWAIDPDGEATEVVSGLGVSDDCDRSSGGALAVIPRRTEDGASLLSVNLKSADETELATDLKLPVGVGAARNANKYAIADAEGGIYRAE